MSYQEVLDREFPHLKGSVYIDYAGAMPLCKSQTKCLADMTSSCLGSTHSKGQLSIPTNEIENLRSELCHMFGTNPGVYQVAFLENTSHAMKVLTDLLGFDKTWSFAYLRDNHNSAFGMRVNAEQHGAAVMTTTEFPATQEKRENNIFVFPYMSNFSGRKYPLKWVTEYQNQGPNHLVLLDSASGTCPQLGDVHPDFLVGSLLKITGIHSGFLMMRRDRIAQLHPPTPAGGTVSYTCARSGAYKLVPQMQKALEQGTPQYINLMLAAAGIRVRKELGGEPAIHENIAKVGKVLEDGLRSLKHSNGQPLIKFMPERIEEFGGNYSFNMYTADGKLIPHADVSYCFMAHKIVARMGVHCNPGGLASIGWEDSEIEARGQSICKCGGCACADKMPYGTVRLTLGVASRVEDAETVLKVLREQFIDNGPCPALPEKVAAPMSLNKITVYPVLGALGFDAKEWPVDAKGLKYNNAWELVTADGEVITLNSNLKLCGLETSIEDMKDLVLKCNGNVIKVPIEGFEESKEAPEVVKALGKVYDEKVAYWIFENLGAYYYLVKANKYDASITCENEASIKELGDDFDARRLHANLVFGGIEKFAELGKFVGNYKIGEMKIVNPEQSTMNAMATVIPFTGKLNPEPLEKLSATRGHNGIVKFGFHFCLESNGKLTIGDKLIEA